MSAERTTTENTGRPWLDLLATGTTILAVAGAVAIAVIRILTHHPFHDECLHVHKLYLMSIGLTPHVDFWCNYPVLGYVLTRPVLAVAGPAAGTLLVLRFLMLGLIIVTGAVLALHSRRVSGRWIWGASAATLVLITPPLGRFLAEYSIDHFAMLAAVGAFVLLFAPPRPFRIGAAAALCLLSFLLTPKYAMPLAAGIVGLAASSVISSRRLLPTILALAAGTAAAVAIALGLYALGGTSPVSNVRYAHVLMAEFKLVADAAPISLAISTVGILLRNLPLLVLVVAGIAGGIATVRATGVVRHLGPMGVLLGTLASAALTMTYMAQYVLPVLLGLAVFTPFAVRLPKSAAGARSFAAAVGVVTLGAVAIALPGAVAEFDQTPANVRDAQGIVAERMGLRMGPPAIETLRDLQALLDRIPPGETVAASPQMHPLFRRDLTFVTADERPSFATLLDADDPAREHFEPDALRRRLAEHAPAYVCLTALEHNYPPGWKEIVAAWLERHSDRYVRRSEHPEAFLRIDLTDR